MRNAIRHELRIQKTQAPPQQDTRRQQPQQQLHHQLVAIVTPCPAIGLTTIVVVTIEAGASWNSRRSAGEREASHCFGVTDIVVVAIVTRACL